MKNIVPILRWAQANGEAKIIDRILVTLLPQFLNAGLKLTPEDITNAQVIDVPAELYQQVLSTAQDLVGQSFK
ncbi:hypothetical protein [Thiomicrorhabdus aquaedulcis]|uniref:hypothetical protein n=1 Tax=Thiomicrorhabdus aquaedulcis TaxID=2211106 RepID=UPI000FD94D95|nr:hypothetical protein [Thiomicrorhabdus aquaedulcis]